MQLLIFCAAVGVVILIAPEIRFFIKRTVLITKLRILCLKNNAKIRVNGPFAPFSRANRSKCDLYVETQYEIFSVKLFGVAAKPYYVTFMPDRKYRITRFVIVPGARGIATTPLEGKDIVLPVIKFDYKMKPEWKMKTLRKILLINPVSMDNRVCTNGSQGYLCDGDFIYGMEAFSYQGLKKLISDRQ